MILYQVPEDCKLMTQIKMKGKYILKIDIDIYVGFQGLRIDGVFTCSVSSHRSKHRLSRRLMFVLNAVLSSTTSQISHFSHVLHGSAALQQHLQQEQDHMETQEHDR